MWGANVDKGAAQNGPLLNCTAYSKRNPLTEIASTTLKSALSVALLPRFTLTISFKATILQLLVILGIRHFLIRKLWPSFSKCDMGQNCNFPLIFYCSGSVHFYYWVSWIDRIKSTLKEANADSLILKKVKRPDRSCDINIKVELQIIEIIRQIKDSVPDKTKALIYSKTYVILHRLTGILFSFILGHIIVKQLICLVLCSIGK